MARKPSPAEVFDDLLTRYERDIAEAFRQAVTDLGAGVDLAGAIAALERNDIAGAIDALNIEPAAYGPLLDAMGRAYAEGGLVAAGQANSRTGPAVVIRFDGRNPRAEAWLRTRSSTLVTQIVDDQRTAVRSALTRGMAAGQNPRAVALDIVGRIDKATGARTGGILGLTSAQEGYVANARAELASGDAADLRAYLGRGRIDKRFNRTVVKAIESGEPIPASTRAKMVVAYERSLLQLRGQTVARVEAMTAIHHGRREAYQQAIDAGRIDVGAVRKVWRSSGDLRVRHTHRALNGESVGFNEPFVSPSGARLLHPMDTSLGAGLSEIANCRCDCTYRIDFMRNLE